VETASYITGDLFAERLATVSFNHEMRGKLINAAKFRWEVISPAIFGALFQSVMDKKKRRAIGAHYTTEQNIMRLIGPLFLDDLHTELERIKQFQPSKRPSALRAFQQRLADIRCFDPACGCGNFLVITYRELRMLEIDVLVELNTQRELDSRILSKVDVNQFYGIELEEFPARITEVAMWMMDHIMNRKLSDALGLYKPRIPLSARATIYHGDALEVDWSSILAPKSCTYVVGNPPFHGSKQADDKQRQQVQRLAGLKDKKGTLDFVAGWFIKAAAQGHSVLVMRSRARAVGQG
jgi:hypothetical protein